MCVVSKPSPAPLSRTGDGFGNICCSNHCINKEKVFPLAILILLFKLSLQKKYGYIRSDIRVVKSGSEILKFNSKHCNFMIGYENRY